NDRRGVDRDNRRLAAEDRQPHDPVVPRTLEGRLGVEPPLWGTARILTRALPRRRAFRDVPTGVRYRPGKPADRLGALPEAPGHQARHRGHPALEGSQFLRLGWYLAIRDGVDRRVVDEPLDPILVLASAADLSDLDELVEVAPFPDLEAGPSVSRL